MKLITAEIKKQLRKAGLRGQVAICKFFNPMGAGTWIVSGMANDEDTLWVLADLGMDCCEQGTISLHELENTRLKFGLKIERDRSFHPKGRTLADFCAIYEQRGTLSGVW